MKLKSILILGILILAYLFFSYNRFYNFIGEKNLKIPNTQRAYTVGQSGQSLKYISLGDSLTAGVGNTDLNNTYVYQFAQKLSQQGNQIDVENLAQPNATTIDLIKNQLPYTIDKKPDFITILIGINDLHGKSTTTDFYKNYDNIMQNLQSKTSAKIILLNLPYLGSSGLVYPPYNYLLDFRTKQFNGIISSIASKYNAKLIYLYENTYEKFQNDQDLYSQDLFHPSDKGYLLWSQIINAN